MKNKIKNKNKKNLFQIFLMHKDILKCLPLKCLLCNMQIFPCFFYLRKQKQVKEEPCKSQEDSQQQTFLKKIKYKNKIKIKNDLKT